MKAIILAAGMGNRLLHLTSKMPKCMLKINGKPIIEYQLEAFRQSGITDISIVKGFLKEQINYPETKSYYKDDYRNSSILLSLFSAENEMNDDFVTAYSDIIFNKNIVENLIGASGDICIAVEKTWRDSYKSKKESSEEDAEKVVIKSGRITQIGKNVVPDKADGEFIGIAKFTKKGAMILKEVYHNIKNLEGPFQESESVKKSILTDILQEIINRGFGVIPVIVKGGWLEIDTLEDLKIAGGEISVPKITPEIRRKLLRTVLDENGFARAIESHSGISAIVANNAITHTDKKSFDALWISSLTESAAKGQPDIELVGLDSRLATVHQIIEVTNKPIIIDGDTGGDPNAFEYFVRKAEALGVSAVIIEDKVYPKRNSLDEESEQILEDPVRFSNKIKRGKSALLTNDLMIIARIESLIAGKGLDDALLRAKIYLESGVDGIMIHSKSKQPNEVLEFARLYEKMCSQLGFRKPLVCVPTTYNSIKESELKNEGFNVVIHANHLLRASMKSMQKVCQLILENERSYEAEPHCSSVSDIFDIVGFSDIKNKEKMWRN